MILKFCWVKFLYLSSVCFKCLYLIKVMGQVWLVFRIWCIFLISLWYWQLIFGQLNWLKFVRFFFICVFVNLRICLSCVELIVFLLVCCQCCNFCKYRLSWFMIVLEMVLLLEVCLVLFFFLFINFVGVVDGGILCFCVMSFGNVQLRVNINVWLDKECLVIGSVLCRCCKYFW